METCRRYQAYNRVPKEWADQKEYVNQYVFVDRLSEVLETDDVIVVDGGGTNVYISFQAFRVKQGQRLIMATATAPMGTGFPEAVGACFARGGGRTICLCGDGSFQLNVQELQTIRHHNLPVKIFILNNDGYVSIRGTQSEFLEGNFAGSSKEGGMSLPDVRAVAAAYKLPTFRITTHADLDKTLKAMLKEPGPALCEVMISPDQKVVPTQGFYRLADGTFRPRPLEDMAPLLDRKEFAENMLVPEWTS
jgi:acetolactate synthase I/II/III large subunit